jgi:hypothetical protein
VVSTTWEAEVEESQYEASLGKSGRPSLKNKQKNKRAGGMAQVVEHLPSKHDPEF